MQTNKKLEIKEVLDNILLPLDAAWFISSVRTDDKSGEIFLQLEYKIVFLVTRIIQVSARVFRFLGQILAVV